MIFRLHKNLIAEITLLIASAISIIVVGLNIYIIIFSIAMHELGHIIFALFCGAKPENFSIHGFGIELTFPGKTPTPKKLLLISAGGPLISAIVSLTAFFTKNPYLFIVNICITIINLLPVYPLDGGNIFYSIFSKFSQRTKLRLIMKISGRIIGVVIIYFGILVLFISSFNISLIYMGFFIFFSAGNQQNHIIEITSAEKVKIEKSSLFIIDSETSILEAANSLPVNAVGAIKNSDGKIISLVTPLYLYELASRE